MKTLITAILCSFSIGLYAQYEGYKRITDSDALQQKIVQASKSQNTITCDFIQEKHLDYLSVVIKSKGKFWFKKPSILRWEYTDPYKYLIVINNGKITIKDDDKKNEFNLNSNKVFMELNDLIINSVNGTLVESDKYQLEMWEGKDTWLVKLTPRNAEIKKVLAHMELFFLKTDMSVDQIRMFETGKDYTIIKLIDKKFNTVINPSVFVVK